VPKAVRLVVDTNIIVSGLITKGTPPAKVLDAVHTKKITLLISDEVLTEYLRVLEYPHIRKYKKITDEAIGHLTALFINEAERVEILTEVTKSPDPDDNKFLSLAVDGQADFLITGDKADLLSLKEFSGIKIITARQVVEKLKL
jgi:putative PIN family toxin of toxin-antitoxin system